jgi:hypothetical protein
MKNRYKYFELDVEQIESLDLTLKKFTQVLKAYSEFPGSFYFNYVKP